MAQTSNGSITITDLTDITDVYLEYCMAADSITTAEDIIAKTIWTPPERGWSTEYPTWQSGYQIWIREVTKKEGITQLEHGTPYLDKAVNQINNNISNIQTKIKKIWSDSTGSYMASGIGGNDVIESNVNTYGFNSKSTTTGISFNYNATPLTSLGTDGLKLYDSNNIPIAQFSDTGITMGKSNGSQSYLFEDYHSLQMIDKEGEAYFYINDLRNSKGIASESFRADLLARDVFNIVDRNILSLRIYYWGELGLSEPVELTNILNISNYTVDGHLYKIELPSAPQSSFSLRINYKADWTQYETKTFNCDGNTRVFYIDETTRNNIYNWQALVDDEGWHCIHYKNETLTSISFYDEVSGIYEFQYTTDTPLKNYTLGIRPSTGKKGNYSVVEGYNNMASGDYSHAEGYGTTANININNPSSPKIAAHAEGYQTTAGGNASHSEGSHTTARGDDSHAEGNNTDAYGEASHAEGGSTNAYGKYSHAEGYSAYAKGDYSHSEGYDTNAFGEASHAEGKGTEASSMGAHAEGYNTTASGYDCSHAEGDSTIASGGRSHAEGGYTIASGGFSHAEGRGTVASGSISHAEGAFTTAMGDYSHAEGYRTEARGAYSHAEGYYTIASGHSSHAQGRYNIEDSTAYIKTSDVSIDSSKTYYTLSDGKFYEVSSPTTSELSNYYEYTPGNAEQAFILGNGTSNANRSNALTVDWQGKIDISGTPYSSSWVQQRDFAQIKRSTIPNSNGMFPFVDAKTPSGDWAIATYGEGFYVSYVTDVDYDSGTNTQTAVLSISNSGAVNASGQYQVHGRPYISTELKSWDNVTIAKGAFSQFSYSVEKAGYTPIGVAGFDIDSASSSGAQVNNVWFGACRLSGNNVIFQLRNHNDSTAAKVKLWAAILYRAT